jgi:hypothetical protein
MQLRRVTRNLNGPSLTLWVEVGVVRKGESVEEVRFMDYTWNTKAGAEAPIPTVWWQAAEAEFASEEKKRITGADL